MLIGYILSRLCQFLGLYLCNIFLCYIFHHSIIIESDVSFRIVSYFPWLCVWGDCTIIFCQYSYTHSGKSEFCFHHYCAGYDVYIYSRSYLFAHYTISLSSLCKLIRRHWTYWTNKMLVGYILSSVRLRLSQFSQLSLMQYLGLCIFSLPI